MSATSNTELNKIIARYWLEFISTGNIEAVCRITAPGWRMHGGLPGLPAGPDGVRKLFSSFGQIKQEWKLDAIIAEGDKVGSGQSIGAYRKVFWEFLPLAVSRFFPLRLSTALLTARYRRRGAMPMILEESSSWEPGSFPRDQPVISIAGNR